jgi:hypothetical protein
MVDGFTFGVGSPVPPGRPGATGRPLRRLVFNLCCCRWHLGEPAAQPGLGDWLVDFVDRGVQFGDLVTGPLSASSRVRRRSVRVQDDERSLTVLIGLHRSVS